MKLTRQDVEERVSGLTSLMEVKHPVVAHRVGVALRKYRPIMNDINDQKQELAFEHAKKDSSNEPILALNDKGEPIGVEIQDRRAFKKALEKFYGVEVEVPEVKGLTYGMLEKAGFPIDGTVVALLGDLLEGEPTDEKAELKT